MQQARPLMIRFRELPVQVFYLPYIVGRQYRIYFTYIYVQYINCHRSSSVVNPDPVGSEIICRIRSYSFRIQIRQLQFLLTKRA